MGVAFDSPELTSAALSLITGPSVVNMYRVRLDEDGVTELWDTTDANGHTQTTRSEPAFDRWLWLRLWLQSLLVDETLI